MSREKLLNDIINGRYPNHSTQYNSPKIIGSVSEILNKNNFKNSSEYREYYYKNILSEIDLQKLSSKIFDEFKDIYDVTQREIYDYLDSLIFEKSWQGIMVREKCAIQVFYDKYKVDKVYKMSDTVSDSKNAIDLIVEKDCKKYICQVKPRTFLSDKYNYHRIRNYEKNIEFLNNNPEFLGAFYLYFSLDNKEFDIKYYQKQSLEKKVKSMKGSVI